MCQRYRNVFTCTYRHLAPGVRTFGSHVVLWVLSGSCFVRGGRVHGRVSGRIHRVHIVLGNSMGDPATDGCGGHVRRASRTPRTGGLERACADERQWRTHHACLSLGHIMYNISISTERWSDQEREQNMRCHTTAAPFTTSPSPSNSVCERVTRSEL